MAQMSYGTKTAVTITLTSLADDSARESTFIDNATAKFLDVLLRIKSNGLAGSVDNLEIYAYASLGDTDYTDGATGSDAAFTAANIKNSPLLPLLGMNGATQVKYGPISLAAVFGGQLPERWGLIVKNSSGANLSATAGDHVVEYQGIKVI